MTQPRRGHNPADDAHDREHGKRGHDVEQPKDEGGGVGNGKRGHDAPPPKNGGGADNTDLAGRMPIWVIIVLTLAFAVAFFAMVVAVWAATDDTDQAVWDRRIFIYQGIFSIVTAIIGALFSTSIHRPQLKKAGREATEAEKRSRRDAARAAEANERTKTAAERIRTDLVGRLGKKAAGRDTRTLVIEPENLQVDQELRSRLEAAIESPEPVFLTADEAEPAPAGLTFEDVLQAVDESRANEDQ